MFVKEISFKMFQKLKSYVTLDFLRKSESVRSFNYFFKGFHSIEYVPEDLFRKMCIQMNIYFAIFFNMIICVKI